MERAIGRSSKRAKSAQSSRISDRYNLRGIIPYKKGCKHSLTEDSGPKPKFLKLVSKPRKSSAFNIIVGYEDEKTECQKQGPSVTDEEPQLLELESDDENSQEHEAFPKVRKLAEEILNREVRPQHTEEEEHIRSCVTCLLVVSCKIGSGTKLETLSSTVLYVAGAIESVENCTKLFNDEIIVCVRTIWLYNHRFRTKLEQKWHGLNNSLYGVLPHVAYNCLAHRDKMIPFDFGNSAISFTNSNIKLIHQYPATSPKTTTEEREDVISSNHSGCYSWTVLLVDHRERVVITSETATPEVQQALTDDDFVDASADLSQVSSYPRTGQAAEHSTGAGNTQKGNYNLQRDGRTKPDTTQSAEASYHTGDPDVVATICMTKNSQIPNQKIKRLAILSLGIQSQVIEQAGHILDVKRILSREQRDKLKPYMEWKVVTHKIDGDPTEISILVNFIRNTWNRHRPDEGFDAIACHVLFLDSDGSGMQLVPYKFSHNTVRFGAAQRKLCGGHKSDIDCYSHLHRLEALHKSKCDSDEQGYGAEWKALQSVDAFEQFFSKHYQNGSELENCEVISFKFPTLQFGWRLGDDVTYYRNHKDSTCHHKFVSCDDPMYHGPDKFKNYLKEKVRQKCHRQ